MYTNTENADTGTLEEPDKSSKANIEVRKTWGFRQSTVAKREMPVEAATDSPESRCPVRRSGRQSKRTDKLEEFLLTTKRALRKSAPASLEIGDPPSQTPTDAETASETSCDGHSDVKAGEDKSESPERRTRSSTRMQNQRKAQGGRLTRGSSRATMKDEGSSDNEEDCKHAGGAGNSQAKNAEKSPGGERCTRSSQPELGSAKTGEQKNLHDDKGSDEESEKGTDESDEDSLDQTAVKMVKRGPIRTYVNKKRAANKSAAPAKAPANKNSTPAKVEPKTVQAAAATTRQRRAREDEDYEEDDDESDSTSSSSSSSVESDDGGYDPNALYCICRQKHNKRYFVFLHFHLQMHEILLNVGFIASGCKGSLFFRFMICCDRCEEWFHGECVGITEARGRLMERNGEDYVCPNCTVKKNQLVRPASSSLPATAELAKLKVDAASVVSNPTASAGKTTTVDQSQSASTVAAPSQSAVGDDQGIKGRIEKATNPTGKKKIKIFQPVGLD